MSEQNLRYQVIEELSGFLHGKVIKAVAAELDENLPLDGFNLFFEDGTMLALLVDDGEIYWKSFTAEELEQNE